jgi:predicted membrane channel-forming protein YqfA (hemolysin III family)
MKKLLIFLTLLGIAGFNLFLVASAQTITPVNITASDVPRIIMNIATWFYRIVLAVAVFFAVVAAYYYLTGNPKNVEKAHKQLFYVVIGVVVALISFGIVQLVQSLI